MIAGDDAEVRAQLGMIVENAVGLVAPRLARDGAFAPIGMRLNDDDTFTFYQYDGGIATNTTQVRDALEHILQQNLGLDTKAMAIVYDGCTLDASGNVEHANAIMIHIDHRRCDAYTFCAPYAFSPNAVGGSDVNVARELTAAPAPHFVFKNASAS